MDGFTLICVMLVAVWVLGAAYMAFVFFKIFRSK